MVAGGRAKIKINVTEKSFLLVYGVLVLPGPRRVHVRSNNMAYLVACKWLIYLCETIN